MIQCLTFSICEQSSSELAAEKAAAKFNGWLEKQPHEPTIISVTSSSAASMLYESMGYSHTITVVVNTAPENNFIHPPYQVCIVYDDGKSEYDEFPNVPDAKAFITGLIGNRPRFSAEIVNAVGEVVAFYHEGGYWQ